MDVVGSNLLDGFIAKHSDVRSQVLSWKCEVEEAHWSRPQDIKDRYRSASFLADNHVIFNLKGNAYRLEVKVSYNNQVVIIKRIDTHSEYSNW